ncbi:MAG: hypothetical protein MK033_12840, partial [Candidatus Caenarcaniphilales bacterium]|nr:hypothetical protein [Candidatus Caenarcaniphilales bacterium]
VKPIDGNGDLTEETEWSYTYYARDAQGNVMGVYELGTALDRDGNYEKDFNVKERPIYGASRVGQNNQEVNLYKRVFEGYIDQTTISQEIIETNLLSESLTAYNEELKERAVDRKVYELSNHLGNVLTVISDRKVAVNEYEYDGSASTGEYIEVVTAYGDTEFIYVGSDVNGNPLGTHIKQLLSANSTDNTVDRYKAKIHSVSDYYPYGMLMPGRNKQSEEYRYGFNGAERDDEVHGEGNSYDLGLRQYDPRLGRMKSLDPRTPEYPWQSPFVYHANSPISVIDYLGGGAGPGDDEKTYDRKLRCTRIEDGDEASRWMKRFIRRYGKIDAQRGFVATWHDSYGRKTRANQRAHKKATKAAIVDWLSSNKSSSKGSLFTRFGRWLDRGIQRARGINRTTRGGFEFRTDGDEWTDEKDKLYSTGDVKQNDYEGWGMLFDFANPGVSSSRPSSWKDSPLNPENYKKHLSRTQKDLDLAGKIIASELKAGKKIHDGVKLGTKSYGTCKIINAAVKEPLIHKTEGGIGDVFGDSIRYRTASGVIYMVHSKDYNGKTAIESSKARLIE